MKIELSPVEARVIGCLIEKEITTPDQYPLSLNSLTLACNQKSNRDPVLDLGEAEVQAALDSLLKKYLVSDRSAGYGGRVTKYKHRFCNTEFGPLKLSAQELGIICVLLLRGPQTPGELRSRTNRLCEFADAAEVETVLEGLIAREDGPFVERLPRSPGAREARYAHRFGTDAALQRTAAATTGSTAAASPVAAAGPTAAPRPGAETGPAADALGGRIERLERLVDALRAEVEALKARSTDARSPG